jgi:DNA replication and repair protein RecF
VRLTRLRASGFRNLASSVLDVDAPMVAFVGSNGQGKTNLLEAVGVLGTLRSFRTTRTAEVVGWDASGAEVEAVGVTEGMTRTWRWGFGTRGPSGGGRTLRRDDRAVDAVTWLSSLRATFFVPSDVALVRGEPALRRALLDRAVLTVRPSYLALARDLRRVLDHKAALLREPRPDAAQLDVIDAQLTTVGAEVTRARSEVMRRLAPAYAEAYAGFSGGEPSTVAYVSAVGTGPDDQIEARLAERLHRGRSGELSQRRVLVGPQRDDVRFEVLGHAARAFASQGQARSVVLAWKLAELVVAREVGEAPLFLLDDLGSELDGARTRALVERVRGLGAQVFVTTTDPRFLPGGTDTARVYTVVAGHVQEAGRTG